MTAEAWSGRELPPFPSAACGEMPTAAPVYSRLTYQPLFVRGRIIDGEGLPKLCSAQIRKIAYIAPQNSDVGFGTGFADNSLRRLPEPVGVSRLRSGVRSGRAAADRPRQAPI